MTESKPTDMYANLKNFEVTIYVTKYIRGGVHHERPLEAQPEVCTIKIAYDRSFARGSAYDGCGRFWLSLIRRPQATSKMQKGHHVSTFVIDRHRPRPSTYVPDTVPWYR